MKKEINIVNDIEMIIGHKLSNIREKNLLEEGISSLQIMRLMNLWKKQGKEINFIELISNPYIDEWEKMLNKKGKSVFSYKTLNNKLEEDKEFPLTDVQYAYWIGRQSHQTLGNVGCHGYLEIDGKNIDMGRLEWAWNLIRRCHPMLRAAFTENGKQKILPYKEKTINVHDMREFTTDECERQLNQTREELSHRLLPIEKGVVTELTVSLLPQNRNRIHFEIDLLVADVQSFQIILRDLSNAYLYKKKPKVNPSWSFESYIKYMDIENKEKKVEDEKYWKKLIPSLPKGPDLVLKQQPEKIKKPRFVRRQFWIDEKNWNKIKKNASEKGYTLASVLLTIYALVLARWSETKEFTINLPLFNREECDDDLKDVVADFSTVVLVNIGNLYNNTLEENISMVQKQMHLNAGHSAYSGINVQRKMSQYHGGEKQTIPVVFSCNLGNDLFSSELRSAFGEVVYMISQTPQVWLDFQAFDQDGGVLLVWDYVEQLFYPTMINEMFDTFCEQINNITNEEKWNEKIDVLHKEYFKRREKYIIEKNIEDAFLHQKFFENANQNPDTVAVIEANNGNQYSYRTIADSALKIAGYLLEKGVQVGERVGIKCVRGQKQIQAIMGILAAGATYIPIPIDFPEERVESMLKQAKARYLLVEKDENKKYISNSYYTEVYIEKSITSEPIEKPIYTDVNKVAYIIYTSGSTGIPKGVEITHAQAWNTIKTINLKFQIGKKDRILNVSSYAFDLSVFDFFGILSIGGSVVTIDEREWRNPQKWEKYIENYKITIWNSVPVLFEMLLEQNTLYNEGKKLDSLKLILLSGDWIRPDLIRQAYNVISDVKIIALGGATEGSIWSNYFIIPKKIPETWKAIPYGYPLENQKYKIVDSEGKDCPDFAIGELCIGGKGVAKGYTGDRYLTEEKFKIIEGERWYFTGDYGMFDADSIIMFLGRKDQQVKVMGHRIELLEIESLMKNLKGVDDATVIIQNKKIIAFFIDNNKYKSEMKVELYEYLKRKLPNYMVPNKIISINEIPVNSNGKLDRTKLLSYLQEDEREERTSEIDEKDIIENKMYYIWRKILKVENIKKTDNYFMLGGDSLLATRLAVKIEKEFNININLEWIFTKPTFEEQVYSIKALLDDQVGITSQNILSVIDNDMLNRYEPFPLTEVQQAYLLGKISGGVTEGISTHYYFELESGELNVTLLEDTLNKLIQRHDMMRAIVLKNAREQRVIERVPIYNISVTDVSNEDARQQNNVLSNIREEMCHEKFDVEQWPAFKIRLTKLANKYRIHLCFDNIFFDGWSISLIINEWQELYQGKTLRPIQMLYRDYVIYGENIKRTKEYKKDIEFWDQKVQTMLPAPELPLIKMMSEIRNPQMSHISTVIPNDVWLVIRNRVRKYGVTLASFLLGAYSEVLGKWSRHQKFTINLTRFNRQPVHKDVNSVVGDFTTLIMLSIDNTKSENFIGRCINIQKELWNILEHPYVSGVEIQRKYAKGNRFKENGVMPVVFTSGLGLEINTNENAVFGKVIYNMSETSQVWLDHQVAENEEGLLLNWDYVEEIFPDNMILEMFEAYKKIMYDLAEHEELWEKVTRCIVNYNLPEEVVNANKTEIERKDTTILERFIYQVKKMPDNIAVISGEKNYTYKDIYGLALKLKLKMEKMGVSRQDVIGIYMDKGVEQVIGAIACLMSNAIFVPLDVKNPYERIEKIINDANIKMIIFNKNTKRQIENIINVECDISDKCMVDNIYEYAQEKDDIAYVIYTSGTTGVPKGVAISNEGVINTLLDINERFNVTEKDSVLSVSKFNFDLSIYDIFGLLITGGTVVIPKDNSQLDVGEWIDIIKANEISIWNSVPAFMMMLVNRLEIEKGKLYSLRWILLSGDWIPIELIDRIKEVAPNAKVISLGGATEASIWSIIYPIDKIEADWNSIPYGRPLTNQKFYILNDMLEIAPVNVTGRLFIAGKGLAKCYWNDMQTTTQKFIYHKDLNERLYDTGDIGKFAPDGNIIFQGREDTQIKLNGYRIEIGEICKALNEIDNIKDSTVELYETNQTKMLVALIVLKESCSMSKENKGTAPLNFINYNRIFNEKNKYQIFDWEVENLLECVVELYLKRLFNVNKISEEDICKQVKSVTKPEYEELVLRWLEIYKKLKGNNKNPQNYVIDSTIKDKLEILKSKLISNTDNIVAILKGELSLERAILEDSIITPEQINEYSNFKRKDMQYLLDSAIHNVLNCYESKEDISILEFANRMDFSEERIFEQYPKGRYVYADESGFYMEKSKTQADKVILNMNDSLLYQGIKPNEFDIVLFNNTIHRAVNIPKTLQYIKHAMKAGGYIIIAEPFEMNELMWITVAIMERGYVDLKDIRKYKKEAFLSLKEWLEVIKNAGLQIVDVPTYEVSKALKMGVLIVKNKDLTFKVDESQVKEQLKFSLPDYMLPQKYIVVENLPLSTNGKIDRKAVKKIIDLHLNIKRKIDKATTEIEEQLQKIWKEVLLCEEVGIKDEFFTIGGDSLRAIQLSDIIFKRLGRKISVKEIYTYPTIEKMGKFFSGKEEQEEFLL